MELFAGTRQTYAEFATQATDSPTFVTWTLGVVDDPEVLGWLDTLPAVKRQPNLVFAAARWHGLPDDATYADLREVLLGDDGSVRATVLSRATQTNEAGRLATLLPLLRRKRPQPQLLNRRRATSIISWSTRRRSTLFS